MSNFSAKLKSVMTELGLSLLSIIIALLVGTLFIFLTNKSPLDAYSALYIGAFGNFSAIANTLWRSTPLILTGLAVALPYRAGLFNIGAEGQFLMGGFAAGVVGFYFTSLPGFIHLPFAIIAGMLVGGLWGGLPGFLKAKMDVHEVIATIMLNHIAIALTINYGINYFRDTGRPATPKIMDTAAMLRFNQLADHPILGKLPLAELFNHPAIRLHLNFVLAIITAIVLWYLLFKTTLGYEIRAVGFNPDGAEYGGINAGRSIIVVMFISGAVAGLAGVGEVLGTHLSFMSGMDAGYGFTGIAVALIGQTHPIGVILGGLLFGALAQGGLEMQFSGIPSEIVMIIQALVIFFVATLQVLKVYIGKKKAKGGVK
ncbi:ABC transporter permease [Halanaerobium salsuginis]|jgi:simple sugar transport system permease protein|uniref:Nucleoside ABC transporter membrane protein n=1 Tax=Halanaerobium salsuginis TaxID=29563 RepID=A0A1I4FA23_9FIRM|nr:ABC transporter permease [Halanaerobium salsuginis]SFL13241.1 nucleoside ABC transporter membrane protein [Halanaerobium salsuginis]